MKGFFEMKKILSFILIIIMSFTFFSCGRNNTNSEYEQLIEYLDNENYSKAVSEIDNISENRNFLTEYLLPYQAESAIMYWIID